MRSRRAGVKAIYLLGATLPAISNLVDRLIDIARNANFPSSPRRSAQRLFLARCPKTGARQCVPFPGTAGPFRVNTHDFPASPGGKIAERGFLYFRVLLVGLLVAFAVSKSAGSRVVEVESGAHNPLNSH